MHLENVVVDATEPQALGRFWEERLGTERLTDEPGVFETRLAVPGGPVLDLCFQGVPEPTPGRPRLDLVLAGRGPESAQADPEGHPFQVVAPDDAAAGPLVAITLESADPRRDQDLWAWLTGWTPVPDAATPALRHPSGLGPRLVLRPEQAPGTGAKNPRHLDVRLAAGEDADAVAAEIAERGGREVRRPEWGDLPWRLYTDTSGNDLCVLPAPV